MRANTAPIGQKGWSNFGNEEIIQKYADLVGKSVRAKTAVDNVRPCVYILTMAKLNLSMDEQKIKELKHLAIDADMTLSDYLAVAGTVTPMQEIIKNKNLAGDTQGAVTPNN